MSAAVRPGSTWTRHGRYATPDGFREVVSVRVPDTGRYVLIDALEQLVDGDHDARIVDDELDSPSEAEALATDYLPRAQCKGRPLAR